MLDVIDVLYSSKLKCLYKYSASMFSWGQAVGQFVEAKGYKKVGLGFDPRWSHWELSLT